MNLANFLLPGSGSDSMKRIRIRLTKMKRIRNTALKFINQFPIKYTFFKGGKRNNSNCFTLPHEKVCLNPIISLIARVNCAYIDRGFGQSGGAARTRPIRRRGEDSANQIKHSEPVEIIGIKHTFPSRKVKKLLQLYRT